MRNENEIIFQQTQRKIYERLHVDNPIAAINAIDEMGLLDLYADRLLHEHSKLYTDFTQFAFWKSILWALDNQSEASSTAHEDILEAIFEGRGFETRQKLDGLLVYLQHRVVYTPEIQRILEEEEIPECNLRYDPALRGVVVRPV